MPIMLGNRPDAILYQTVPCNVLFSHSAVPSSQSSYLDVVADLRCLFTSFYLQETKSQLKRTFSPYVREGLCSGGKPTNVTLIGREVGCTTEIKLRKSKISTTKNSGC